MDEYQVIVAWSGACILRTTNRQRAIDYCNQQGSIDGETRCYVFSLGAKMIIYRNWGTDRILYDENRLEMLDATR